MRTSHLWKIYQGFALRKISGSPHSSWGAQASQVGRPSTSGEEVFCTHTNLTSLLITKLGNFSFWVRQKLACCFMKFIKVFVPLRFKTRNVSNAAELFRFQRGKSKRFQQVYANFIKIFGSNIGKLCFLPVIQNLKINFQKVNQCSMKYNGTEFYTRQITLKFPWKIPCNRCGPKSIVLIKNKSSLIFFSILSVNLLG